MESRFIVLHPLNESAALSGLSSICGSAAFAPSVNGVTNTAHNVAQRGNRPIERVCDCSS
jgi:hypothetical protein